MREPREWQELDEEQLTHEQIEKRAYEIYLQHNGENGHELEDWLIAEEEVTQRRPSERSASMRYKAVAVGQQR